MYSKSTIKSIDFPEVMTNSQMITSVLRRNACRNDLRTVTCYTEGKLEDVRKAQSQERRLNMNLVVGATGMLGSEICRQLAAAGKPVRALVRATSDPAKVEKLVAHGAEIFEGDVREPASLAVACQGASAVISTGRR